MKKRTFIYSIFACAIAITVHAETNMLFDFENGQSAPVEWQREWGLNAYVSNNGAYAFSGTNAMTFHVAQGQTGSAWNNKLVIFKHDIASGDRASYFTGYTNFGLYLHEGSYSANKIRVRLYEDIIGTKESLPYKEVWYKEYNILNSSDYQRFDFVLKSVYTDPTGFARDGDIVQPTNGVDIGILNLANIEKIAIIINKDTRDAKSPYWNPYHIDDIQLWNPAMFIPPPTNELFVFENGENDVAAWYAWHDGDTTWKSATDVAQYVAEGDYAMEIKYDQSIYDPTASNFYTRLAVVNCMPYWSNWSAFNTISYAVREQIPSTNTVYIIVEESSGQRWIETTGHVLTDSYETMYAHLASIYDDSVNGMTVETWGSGTLGENTTLDLNDIVKVELKFDKGTFEAKSPQFIYLYVDEIMLTNKVWWMPPANGVIDDFEFGAGWSAWNSTSNITTVTHIDTPEYVHGGDGSMCIRYNQSLVAPEPGYTDYWRRYATASTVPYWTNWNGYTGVSYWLRSQNNDTNQIHFVIEESSGQIWQQSHMITATTGWQQVKAYFQTDTEQGFSIYQWGHVTDPKGTNMVIDLDAITNIFFRIDKGQYGSKAPPVYTYFYIDDLELMTESIPSFTAPTLPMLFDFENAEIGYWSRWKFDMTSVNLEEDEVFDGDYALALAYQQGTEGTNYYSQLCTFGHPTPSSDVSAYTKINYRAKESQFSDNTIGLWITETNGQKWMQRNLTTLTDSWQQVSVVLKSKFDDAQGFDSAGAGVGPSGTNTILDLDMIAKIGFEFNKGTTNSKAPEWTTFYIDNVEVSTQEVSQYAYVNLSQHSFGFQKPLAPQASQYRFVSTNSSTLSWETSGMSDTYWELVTYTTNADNAVGLRGLDRPEFGLLTRWWTGPNTNAIPPDPMVQSNWVNQWGFLVDKDMDMNPMLTTEGEVAAAAVGSFELYFGIEAFGVYTQRYSAPITVELRLGE